MASVDDAAPMDADDQQPPPLPPPAPTRTLRPRSTATNSSLASPVDNDAEDKDNEIVLLPSKACPKSDYDYTLYRFVGKVPVPSDDNNNKKVNNNIKVAMCADRKKERVVCQEEYDRGRDKWLRFCQDVKGKRVDGGGDIDVFGE